jgi:hypothetical protein
MGKGVAGCKILQRQMQKTKAYQLVNHKCNNCSKAYYKNIYNLNPTYKFLGWIKLARNTAIY